MSDIVSDADINRKRLEVHKAEMHLSIQRMELRRAEVARELKLIETNTAAALNDIASTDEQLKNLGGTTNG